MNESQGSDPTEPKRNFNAPQRALEVLKLAMENQLIKTQGGEPGLESLL
jgi:hypothetical protein